MSEAGILAPTKLEVSDKTPELNNLIRDAEYVVLELARGDAVPAGVLVKAKPFIDPVMKAALAAKSAAAPGDAEYRALQSAMVDLMTAIAPVTVSSLRDTQCSGVPGSGLSLFGWIAHLFREPKGDTESTAEQFSDGLILASVLFLVLAMAGTLAASILGDTTLSNVVTKFLAQNFKTWSDAHVSLSQSVAKVVVPWNSVFNVVQPVLFGGLGAFVYLLRSLHKHIHERTFDRRYKPEYINRAVLGMVSGGVVTLLAKEISGFPEFQGVGPATLAFLVGYNTDLLFSLIERISNALFPKVPEPPAPDVAVMPAAPAKKPGDDDKPDDKPDGK